MSTPTPSNPSFLTKVGGFSSTNGAEIPAFDALSDRLFVVAGNTIEILNLSNPATPSLLGTLTPSFPAPTGTALIPNSVAVKNGVVAVAYAVRNTATGAQQTGKVAFFSTSGAFLNAVDVGALPDMLTFTPDGSKVLVANEGEPNSYNQATSFDPEGSISIIDLSGGVGSATVQNAGFSAFNSQIAALKASGVRIFGPNATVAQDLEPEYIAVSADGQTALVTLQENNAIATLNIATATVTSITPLGVKDHNAVEVTNLSTYQFTNLPVLGTTTAGQDITLGGFSGLFFEGTAPNGNLKFVTNTDRGPNGEPINDRRPFLLPDFAPEIIRFELNPTSGQIALTERIQLKSSPTQLLTGLPNTTIAGTTNTPYNDEVPIDLFNNTLPLDALGGDIEGVVVAADGSFWTVDEYRPGIYHFDASGVLIERYVPQGTAAAAGQPVGTYGTEALPAVLGQRRQNRGFEAIAIQDGKIYAFVQSPIRNPSTLSNGTLNGLRNIRIVEFDPTTETTRQFLYTMDNPDLGGTGNTRADKIGDAVAIGNGQFLVVERDDDAIDSDPLSQIEKKVYRFNLGGATEISTFSGAIALPSGGSKTIDQMTAAELASVGINPIQKYLHVDLAKAGYNTVEKVEGLALVDANTIAVVNDNDFNVAGVTIDFTTGTFTPAPNPEPITLGLITTAPSNALDASDRDSASGSGSINIRPQPVVGLYQPDAIASFTASGQTYYITANEGDARDYTGFAEEVRVGASSYILDPAAFPNAATLKNNANLGRLTVTNATGKIDGDADFDRIEVFGARSFSILDSTGKLVYDSGDDLERITAAALPGNFNANSDANDFDSRSDNKGPEPEGVVTAKIHDRTYAFVGLERIGGIITYDVTNPTVPTFVQYLNSRNFSTSPITAAGNDSGPEGLIYVSAADSPNGRPLVITANEVSNSVAVYEIAAIQSSNGTTGRDTVTGTVDRDRILGGLGGDILTGGAGADEFVYSSIRDAGDRITDFTIGQDQIVFTQLLDSLVANGYSGNAIADGFVRVVTQGSGSAVQIDQDGFGSAASFRSFITLDNIAVAALNNPSNFVF